jgi:hypothetical protein
VRTAAEWRSENPLPSCRVYQSGYVLDTDPPEVRDALRALSELGCHGADMVAAGRVLRSRPSVGEYLFVVNGTARRFFHRCCYGDAPEFGAARVVWVAPAEQS